MITASILFRKSFTVIVKDIEEFPYRCLPALVPFLRLNVTTRMSTLRRRSEKDDNGHQ